MEITQEDSRADAADEMFEIMQEMQETGVIPPELWAQMGDTFGFQVGSNIDPDVDPILLEALGVLGGGD